MSSVLLGLLTALCWGWADVLARYTGRALRFEAAGLLDTRLGQLSDAAEHLRRILALSPEDADALDMLASIFVREKQYAELVDVLG